MKKKISIAATCYNEINLIENFVDKISNTLDKYLYKYEYEIIISDNNSTDGTIDELRKICINNKKVKVLINFKNYGAEKSSLNCLKLTTGDVIITSNIDLEEGTKIIENFIQEWESGKTFSVGKKAKENPTILLKTLKKLFYFFFNKFSAVELIPNSTSIMLGKQMLEKLVQFGENNADPFVRSLAIEALGPPQSIVEADYNPRIVGYSKHNLFDLYSIASSGFFKSTSFKMPKYITLTSICFLIIVIICFLITLTLNIFKIINLSFFEIIFSTIILIFLSTILIFCGFIMEYLISILTALKNEKVVLKEKINFDQNK
jgi:glycosyltransferase involved in cell wall biosynthesis